MAGQAEPTLDDEPPPVMDVLRLLWSKRSFRYMSIGGALHAFVGNGIGLYIPMMFQRSHGLGTGEIGTGLFGLGFFGMVGTFGAGYLCDRLGEKDRRWYMWLPGIMTLMHVPFAAFTYLYHDPQIALMVYAVAYIFRSRIPRADFCHDPKAWVPLRMRALAASILLFILNIIGLGLGPQITGILSDTINLTTDLGVNSLRWAMVSVLVFNIISAVLYIMAGRTVVEDMR